MNDEERREVAQKLRSERYRPWDDVACEMAQCVGIGCCNSECHGSSETPECAEKLAHRLADLIEPEPEPTFDEWLKDVKETCFASMEGCDEPEWSLFSTINDAIDFYRSGKSGFECKEIDYGE